MFGREKYLFDRSEAAKNEENRQEWRFGNVKKTQNGGSKFYPLGKFLARAKIQWGIEVKFPKNEHANQYFFIVYRYWHLYKGKDIIHLLSVCKVEICPKRNVKFL